MAYATVEQLRAYLKQVATGGEEDAKLGDILDRATSIVDSALGFSFAGYAAATKRVHAEESVYFRLPPYDVGSITALATVGGDTIEDDEYEEIDSFYLYNEDGWNGLRYSVTADFGYGTVPDDVIQMTLEVAVNIWRQREKGLFTDVLGVSDGGQLLIQPNALTNQQLSTVRRYRRKFLAEPVQ